MIKKIILQNREIEYIIKRNKQAKSLKLYVENTSRLKIIIPYFTSFKYAEKFILEKSTWIVKNIEYMEKNTIKIKADSLINNYHSHKARAKKIIKTKIEHYNQFYNFEYNKICIKNHKSRWGSCSSDKNLNFNYRLIFLPEYLADYIVVHELCHLQEMNHSVRFWSLVAKTVPEYKNRVDQLKKIRF